MMTRDELVDQFGRKGVDLRDVHRILTEEARPGGDPEISEGDGT